MNQKSKHLNLGINKIDAATKKAVEKFTTTNGIDGISLGFEKLDEIFCGLKDGDVYTIGGRPSMGKTSFAFSLINNIAVKQHIPTLLFSLECNSERCAQRLLAHHCDIPLQHIHTGLLIPEEWDRLDKQITDVLDSSIYIDDTAFLTIDDLIKKAKETVEKHGIKIIFIDYLQLISTPYRANRTRNDDVADIMHGIKCLARELSLPIVLLSQLNRCPENRTGFEAKRPMLCDLRDSGTIEEDSDAIIFIHRPEVYHIYQDDYGRDLHNMAQIIIKKNRSGYTGDVLMKFDGDYSKFSEVKSYIIPTDTSLSDDIISSEHRPF